MKEGTTIGTLPTPAVVIHPRPAWLNRRAVNEARRNAAAAILATGMRVPVYFSELAIATRVCLYGESDQVARAMVAHQRHLARCGVKGVFETTQ